MRTIKCLINRHVFHHGPARDTAVTNAGYLAFFIVNISQTLLQPFRQTQPDFSILDLKSHYQGYHYATETVKMLPQKPDAILLAYIFQRIAHLGAIHPRFFPAPNPLWAKVLIRV